VIRIALLSVFALTGCCTWDPLWRINGDPDPAEFSGYDPDAKMNQAIIDHSKPVPIKDGYGNEDDR
jgi:hypothetical protein